MQFHNMRRSLVAIAMVLALTPTSVAQLHAEEHKATLAVRPSICLLPPLAESWWDEIYGPIETTLSRREAMVQFGAVGVIIGLFIIWYRRP
jgi:hypothetical protein